MSDDRPDNFFSNYHERAVIHMIRDGQISADSDVSISAPNKSGRREFHTNHLTTRSGLWIEDTDRFITRHDDDSITINGEHVYIKVLTDEITTGAKDQQIILCLPRQRARLLADLLCQCLDHSTDA